MACFRVSLADRSTQLISDVDAYQQEGPLTTFFELGPGRQVVDSWSVRHASFRTADITAIRRDEVVTAIGPDETDQLTRPTLRSA